jgi:asparagine synthase (glutamine-hydrolysing)
MLGYLNFDKNEFYCNKAAACTLENKSIYFSGNLLLNLKDTSNLLNKILRENKFNLLENHTGQFVIALFNKKEKVLFLLRDHFGIVPLYYTIEKKTIIFGTDIKSIYSIKESQPECNSEVLHEYFMFRYIAGEPTLFKEIFEIKPRSVLKIDSKLKITHQDYYSLSYTENDKIRGEQTTRLFEEKFWDSLKNHTWDRKEKRFGILSSGGIDSSILVSCSKEIFESKLNTYYVGNENYAGSRLKDVDYISNLYSTKHFSLLVSDQDFADNLVNTIRINEEPLNHPSSVLRYCLCKYLKDEVDVFLSGEGADCLYCGYYIFDLVRYFYIYNPVKPITKFIAKLILRNQYNEYSSDRIEKLLNALVLSPKEYLFLYSELISLKSQTVEQIINFKLPSDYIKHYLVLLENQHSNNLLNNILQIYQTHYIFEVLKTITKIGEEFKIELRHPFLDINLLNQFNQFRWSDKIKFFKRKHQIVELGKKYLPESFFKKGKEGFGVPLSKLFYHKDSLEVFADMLNDQKTRERGIFNGQYLDGILDKYHKKMLPDAAFETVIWPIINLELWFRKFIEKEL